jgi:hypothetical protein
MTFIKYSVNNIQLIHFSNQFADISPNVPAVYDVFLRPIRKNAQHFYGRKKMWRSKPPQRAFQRPSARPTGGLRSPSRRRRRAYTELLKLQKKPFFRKML